MPDDSYDDRDAPDLTSPNGAPGAMDEDGELADDSPLILSLALKHNGAHTDIIVTIPSPRGLHSKRIVITGEVTARKLGKLLLSVASW